MSASLSARLREETRESHERIESSLNLLRPGITINEYARLLERWYGFERTWERIGPGVLSAVVGDFYFPPRHRLPMLKADLLACGRAEAQIAALPSVAADALPWSTPAGALGVLYVTEGSTLGGQHVAKFVRQHLPLTAEHGIAYFTSYGPDVGKRWRETKALLDSVPVGVDENQVITAAIATFNYLGKWLNEG